MLEFTASFLGVDLLNFMYVCIVHTQCLLDVYVCICVCMCMCQSQRPKSIKPRNDEYYRQSYLWLLKPRIDELLSFNEKTLIKCDFRKSQVIWGNFTRLASLKIICAFNKIYLSDPQT